MDPAPTLNLDTETSLLLIDELLSRGHQVYWFEPSHLILEDNKLTAIARAVLSIEPLQFGIEETLDLNQLDALLPRNDPPFNETYLHITYLLNHLGAHVVQFNSAHALRNYNEKLLPLLWPSLAPRTLTTMNPQALLSFLDRYKDIVIKPLDDCSGRGIKRLMAKDKPTTAELSALFKDAYGDPRFIQAQEFLPAVREGDKRIYLVGGKPVGIVNRIPRSDTFLANIHQGATCVAADLTEQEADAINTIAPWLTEAGIFLAGLDFIAGKITEVNITSPSAIRQINHVTGQSVHLEIVTAMIEHVESKQAETNVQSIAAD
jgi:glutathione synthase